MFPHEVELLHQIAAWVKHCETIDVVEVFLSGHYLMIVAFSTSHVLILNAITANDLITVRAIRIHFLMQIVSHLIADSHSPCVFEE